ncbi:hypothetical protein Metev_1226 [Methanohalobium evestigatum Z-7303]|uniref:Uncharacterized protein n=1 Tax=Methanohalobium evestigatum (strain ATCC BAA-1072 / DSM 3721 / NBRC 107634 / OCM 161 / Z-7303) TaxID=644295 RepID=D7E7M5_METEZ|nr:hypothetical protein [Methanohalobium evestigatum]ADI74098.1 hypothetical protein Metev_1226 [Methanohalobium evestigatum Z-7303]
MEPKKLMKQITPLIFTRDGGGWMRKVESLDKKYTNGYSLVGPFYNVSKKQWLAPGLYIDCSKSDENGKIRYCCTLVKLNYDSTVKILDQQCNNQSWAVDMWDVIEKHLPEFKSHEVILKEERKQLSDRIREIDEELKNLDDI